MDDIKEITSMLEYFFLKQLIKGMEEKTITYDEAKVFARDFLPIEPFSSVEDAKAKVDTFVQNRALFLPLQEYVHAYHSEKQVNNKIEEMRKHMQNNDIDKALSVAKV